MIKNCFIIAATLAAKTFGASMNCGVNRSQEDVSSDLYVGTKLFVQSFCRNGFPNKKSCDFSESGAVNVQQSDCEFEDDPRRLRRADEGVGARVIMQSLNVSNDEEKIPPTHSVASQDVHTADLAST